MTYTEAERFKIAEASQMPVVNADTRPSVFRAKRLDGTVHVGANYQPKNTKVGHRFHYDHGCGISPNKDAEVVWVSQ